jgi:hypothetical protein
LYNLPKMKCTSVLCSFLFFFLSITVKAQLSIILSSSLCSGDTAVGVANTGTFPATAYSWSASSPGPVFISPNSSVTMIVFPSAGIYTITLAAIYSNVSLYAADTITVYPTPVLTITATNATICPGQSATLIATGASSYTWDPLPGLIVAFNGTAYVAPGSTSIYSVTGKSTAGCMTGSTYTINLGVAPNLTTSTTATSVRAGHTVTITAFGANSFTWTGTTFSGTINQQTISAIPGTYSVLGSNGGGCIDSTYITIGSSLPLNMVLTSNKNIICEDHGDSLVPAYLTASGAVNYTWTPYSPGYMTYSLGPSTSVSPTVSTCYTVFGITGFCSATSVICVNVGTCTSIKENEPVVQFSVIPNPVRDKLFLYSATACMVTVLLMDMVGKVIMNQVKELDSALPQHLDIEDLPPGFYFLNVGIIDKSPQRIRIIRE